MLLPFPSARFQPTMLNRSKICAIKLQPDWQIGSPLPSIQPKREGTFTSSDFYRLLTARRAQ
jgi:hypothetical protein